MKKSVTMSHGRKMGFMWGLLAGICLCLGIGLHPAFFLLTIIPLVGVWNFRDLV